ncbi:MAG TPA: hypothetical protein VFU59_02160 [Candidatus Eisenbacteria bacterium]|nr:hypothetical protein [Candidatus Eisenbacteria bacterium]
MNRIEYSPAERGWLAALAVAGFAGVNGAFFYGLLAQPGSLRAALTNPISLAFLVEALLMLAALAYFLGKWGVSRLSWRWFLFLSLLGSMAFALPVVLLWRGRHDASRPPTS